MRVEREGADGRLYIAHVSYLLEKRYFHCALTGWSFPISFKR